MIALRARGFAATSAAEGLTARPISRRRGGGRSRARTGRRANQLDHYDCPRCGAAMLQVVDPQQQHIRYENCSGCAGSFFDAGEFLDLSQLTLSDFFKRLVTPSRS